MPPKWKGGPGRDWSRCECRNCRWLWLDAVPSDVPELRDTVAWAAGSPFGANRLDRKHKQLHLLLPCTRLQKETPAPQRGASGRRWKKGRIGRAEADSMLPPPRATGQTAAAAAATDSRLPNKRARVQPSVFSPDPRGVRDRSAGPFSPPGSAPSTPFPHSNRRRSCRRAALVVRLEPRADRSNTDRRAGPTRSHIDGDTHDPYCTLGPDDFGFTDWVGSRTPAPGLKSIGYQLGLAEHILRRLPRTTPTEYIYSVSDGYTQMAMRHLGLADADGASMALREFKAAIFCSATIASSIQKLKRLLKLAPDARLLKEVYWAVLRQETDALFE